MRGHGSGSRADSCGVEGAGEDVSVYDTIAQLASQLELIGVDTKETRQSLDALTHAALYGLRQQRADALMATRGAKDAARLEHCDETTIRRRARAVRKNMQKRAANARALVLNAVTGRV